jgi:hypothetical protein
MRFKCCFPSGFRDKLDIVASFSYVELQEQDFVAETFYGILYAGKRGHIFSSVSTD